MPKKYIEKYIKNHKSQIKTQTKVCHRTRGEKTSRLSNEVRMIVVTIELWEVRSSLADSTADLKS